MCACHCRGDIGDATFGWDAYARPRAANTTSRAAVRWARTARSQPQWTMPIPSTGRARLAMSAVGLLAALSTCAYWPGCAPSSMRVQAAPRPIARSPRRGVFAGAGTSAAGVACSLRRSVQTARRTAPARARRFFIGIRINSGRTPFPRRPAYGCPRCRRHLHLVGPARWRVARPAPAPGSGRCPIAGRRRNTAASRRHATGRA